MFILPFSQFLILSTLFSLVRGNTKDIVGINEEVAGFSPITNSKDFCMLCCNPLQGLNSTIATKCGFQNLALPKTTYPTTTNSFYETNSQNHTGYIFNGGLVSQGDQIVAAYDYCTTQCAYNHSLLLPSGSVENQVTEVAFNGYFYQYIVGSSLTDHKNQAYTKIQQSTTAYELCVSKETGGNNIFCPDCCQINSIFSSTSWDSCFEDFTI